MTLTHSQPIDNAATLDAPDGARLVMRGVCKRFGATLALRGVDLAVRPGEVVALVGENGAGKSTLMKVLSGAHAADTGEMWLDGERYAPRGPLAARQAGVAMIYQELSLAPHLTVEENILLGLEPTGLGLVRRGEVRRRAREALARLGHGEIRPDRRAGELTIAAQQLVEIARALANQCRVLVLDEPTSSLTRADVVRLFELIGRLKDQGHAIVYISHFIEEVKQVADRFVVLRDGQTVGQGRTADCDAAQIVSMMVGRQVSSLYPRSPRTPGEVILEVSGLSGASKPQGATLTLRRGQVLGLAGLVGAGRTELLRALFGLDPVRSGKIKLGHWSGAATPGRRWAQGMGFLSEDRKQEGLALSLSIADNLTLSRLAGFGPAGMVRPSRQEAAAQGWIEKLAIRCRSPRQKAGDLSGGNQQKVALARLLQHGVDVLLLDEPTRGIDVAAKALFYQTIDELAAGKIDGRARAVLVVSSYLPELLGLCDQIAVMCRGRLGEVRPVEQWDEQQLLLAATGS